MDVKHYQLSGGKPAQAASANDNGCLGKLFYVASVLIWTVVIVFGCGLAFNVASNAQPEPVSVASGGFSEPVKVNYDALAALEFSEAGKANIGAGTALDLANTCTALDNVIAKYDGKLSSDVRGLMVSASAFTCLAGDDLLAGDAVTASAHIDSAIAMLNRLADSIN